MQVHEPFTNTFLDKLLTGEEGEVASGLQGVVVADRNTWRCVPLGFDLQTCSGERRHLPGSLSSRVRLASAT